MSSPVQKLRSALDYDSAEAIREALSKTSLDEWALPTYDSETSSPLSLDNELQRLMVLKSYRILDSEDDKEFQAIAEKTMEEFNVPWAAVSMIDLGRQWFKVMAEDDLDIKETSRKDSFCSHTVQRRTNDVMVVPDASDDSRFRNNPMVTGEPGFRFYAGAPLLVPEGHKIGTLCVLDKQPRPQGLSTEEEKLLTTLANKVVHLLVERRRNLPTLKRSVREIKCPSPTDPQERVRTSISVCNSPVDTKKSKHVAVVDGNAIRRPVLDVILPDPKTAGVSPDDFLLKLVHAQWGVDLTTKSAMDLESFFLQVTEEQMSAYSIEIVSATREKNVAKLQEFLQTRGRSALNCFNRFGEGLLNLACRRGFTDVVAFLLSDDVALDVRISDDYGRTPLHDACWNPEPQLDICTWVMERDPALFLVRDRRGYTPFQYARKSDWNVWRQFLFDRRHLLGSLLSEDIMSKFAAAGNSK